MKLKANDFRVQPGAKVKLGKWPTSVKPYCKSKEDYHRLLAAHVDQLSTLQRLHYASDRHALLLIFQGMDAAGKDGAIRHVMSGVNPQGCEVFSFKEPSAEELQHDFLWRTTCRLPERGRIGIFNRSYYEEVLVVRVHPELLRSQKLPDRVLDEKHCGRNGTSRSPISRSISTATEPQSSRSSSICQRTSSASASSSALTSRTRTGSSARRTFMNGSTGRSTRRHMPNACGPPAHIMHPGTSCPPTTRTMPG